MHLFIRLLKAFRRPWHRIRTTITNIDDDVLGLILEYLSSRDLGSLSRVSRRFRPLCLQAKFRHYKWTWHLAETEIPSIPLHVRNFIIQLDIFWSRYLFTAVYSVPPIRVSKDELATRISEVRTLTSLKAVNVDVSSRLPGGVDLSLLCTLLSLPTLEVFVCGATWELASDRFPDTLFEVFPTKAALRRWEYPSSLTYRTASVSIPPARSGQRSSFQISIEVHNLRMILSYQRDTLEAVRLPAQLAGHVLCEPLPALEELTVEGWCSDEHAGDSTLLWRHAIDPTSSRLRILHLCIVRRQELGHGSPSHDDAREMREKLRNLKILTLDNPYIGDPILEALPVDLEELCILSFPLPYRGNHYRDGVIPVDVATCTTVHQILSQTSLGYLKRLALAYSWDETELLFLSSLPDLFPNLNCLEIHRYDWPREPYDVVPILQDVIVRMHGLRTLRIHFEATHDQVDEHVVLHPHRLCERYDSVRERAVQDLISCHPRLDRIDVRVREIVHGLRGDSCVSGWTSSKIKHVNGKAELIDTDYVQDIYYPM